MQSTRVGDLEEICTSDQDPVTHSFPWFQYSRLKQGLAEGWSKQFYVLRDRFIDNFSGPNRGSPAFKTAEWKSRINYNTK